MKTLLIVYCLCHFGAAIVQRQATKFKEHRSDVQASNDIQVNMAKGAQKGNSIPDIEMSVLKRNRRQYTEASGWVIIGQNDIPPLKHYNSLTTRQYSIDKHSTSSTSDALLVKVVNRNTVSPRNNKLLRSRGTKVEINTSIYDQLRKSLRQQSQTSKPRVHLSQNLENSNTNKTSTSTSVDRPADSTEDFTFQSRLESDLWNRFNHKHKGNHSQAVRSYRPTHNNLTNDTSADQNVASLQKPLEHARHYQNHSYPQSESNHGVANMAVGRVGDISSVANTHDLNSPGQRSFNTRTTGSGPHVLSLEGSINHNGKNRGRPGAGSQVIDAPSSRPTADLAKVVKELVSQVKRLHKQQVSYRQRHHSLQRLCLSRPNKAEYAPGQTADTSHQPAHIELDLRDFHTKAETIRKEIMQIKSDQQRCQKTVNKLLESNRHLVKSIPYICKEELFSLAQRHKPDSGVINSTAVVTEADSRGIKNDIKRLKENMQETGLLIDIQTETTTVLEGKINKALAAVNLIQKDMEQMRDLMRTRLSEVLAQAPSGGREDAEADMNDSDMSGSSLMEDSNAVKHSQNRKARDLTGLAFILQEKENSIDGAKRVGYEERIQDSNSGGTKRVRNEEKMQENNEASVNSVQTYNKHGGVRTVSNTNDNIMIDVVGNIIKNITSLQESQLFSFDVAGPVLHSSSHPHLDEELNKTKLAAEHESLRQPLLPTPTSVPTHGLNVDSSTTRDIVSDVRDISTNDRSQDMTWGPSVNGRGQQPQGRQIIKTSEQLFTLSHSVAHLGNTLPANADHAKLTKSIPAAAVPDNTVSTNKDHLILTTSIHASLDLDSTVSTNKDHLILTTSIHAGLDLDSTVSTNTNHLMLTSSSHTIADLENTVLINTDQLKRTSSHTIEGFENTVSANTDQLTLTASSQLPTVSPHAVSLPVLLQTSSLLTPWDFDVLPTLTARDKRIPVNDLSLSNSWLLWSSSNTDLAVESMQMPTVEAGKEEKEMFATASPHVTSSNIPSFNLETVSGKISLTKNEVSFVGVSSALSHVGKLQSPDTTIWSFSEYNSQPGVSVLESSPAWPGSKSLHYKRGYAPNEQQIIARSSLFSSFVDKSDLFSVDHVSFPFVESAEVTLHTHSSVLNLLGIKSSSLHEAISTAKKVVKSASGGETSTYSAQYVEVTSTDQILPSVTSHKAYESYTVTPEVDRSDQEPPARIDTPKDILPTGAEEDEHHRATQSSTSGLADSRASSKLRSVDTSRGKPEADPATTTIPEVDWSDTRPSSFTTAESDLMSTRVNVGRDAQTSLFSSQVALDAWFIHVDNVKSIPVTPTDSMIYKTLSTTDRLTTDLFSSMESLLDSISSQVEESKPVTDFVSNLPNPVSYSDEPQLSLMTGRIHELYTTTPGLDWVDTSSTHLQAMDTPILSSSSPGAWLGASTGSHDFHNTPILIWIEAESSLDVSSPTVATRREPVTGEAEVTTPPDSYSAEFEFSTILGQAVLDPVASTKSAVYITVPGRDFVDLETSTSREHLLEIMSTPVADVNLLSSESTNFKHTQGQGRGHFPDMNATQTQPGRHHVTQVENTREPPVLAPGNPSQQTATLLANMSITSGLESTEDLSTNETERGSPESSQPTSQTNNTSHIGYIQRLEDKIDRLEKIINQLTSTRTQAHQEEHSAYPKKTDTDQNENEVELIQKVASELMQQLDREKEYVQIQKHDLKKELEQQRLYVENHTSGLMKELEKQKIKTNEFMLQLEKQENYTQNQMEWIKEELNREIEHVQNQTSDITLRLLEQNVYIQNQTNSVHQKLRARTITMQKIRSAAARTSKMVTHLTRQVSAINITEFTSALHESLQNLTRDIPTQEQWNASNQRIVKVSLENQAQISQIKETLLDTTHSVTKLQGRVRSIHQMGERWYKSLQGHVIRLNNTVQDLIESSIHLSDVNRDQTIDHHAGHGAQVQTQLDSLNIQLLYNSNRLSSLEASMLNMSLTQCRRSSADASQEAKVLALSVKQDEMRKELSALKEKVTVAELSLFRVHSSVKSTDKAVNSLRTNVTSLMSVVPELHGLRTEVTNVRGTLPQDCHEYLKRGYYESGVYVINPKHFNRTVRVYCLMEPQGFQKTCHFASSKNHKEHIHNAGNNNKTEHAHSTNNIVSETTSGDNELLNDIACRGWTVIQRRTSGTLNFTRTWVDYADGFGKAEDEFWIGNDFIHVLTRQKNYELRFLMEDIHSNIWEATYSLFDLAGKEDSYRIHLSGYRGNASDGMSNCESSAFSTVDFDNDLSSSHCAFFNGGGWWYRQCHVTNLNGPYAAGMAWFNRELRDWVQMRSSMIMIGPKTKR